MRSVAGSLMRCHPRAVNKIGSKSKKENPARVCERISGSMECGEEPSKGSLPVKTARPKTAETPQRKAAAAIRKYPRRGCGAAEVACCRNFMQLQQWPHKQR